MKYIKLAIILLVSVGAVYGLYKLFSGEIDKNIQIPDGLSKKCASIEKRIEEQIENASNSSFCTTSFDDILNTINLFFEKEPSNKATYTMKLQGAYSRKFVQQANYVFNGTRWNSGDIRIIRKELKKCKTFFPDDSDLSNIEVVLKNYDALKDFDSQVRLACSQKPQCLDNHLYLYLSDNWDAEATRILLNSIPQYSGKVTNSPIYKNTRQDKVKERLRAAHTRFINEKMQRSEEEAKNYNYNSARYGDYSRLGEYLYECFDTYRSLWGWDSVGQQWQIEVRDWEIYVIEQQTEN